MNLLKKTKTLLKASIVIAIALAFVLPVSAATSNTSIIEMIPKDSNDNFRSGEWIEQASGFQAAQYIRFLDAVNETIAWAIGRDGSGSDTPTTEFTMTVNGGNTWTVGYVKPISDPYGLGNICALNEMVAYVALYNHAGAQDTACGVYKTSDGGLNWIQLGNYPISFANNVIFWNENDGVVLGDTKDDYFEDYTTHDGGVTWTRVPLANYSGVPAVSGEGGWTGCVDVVGDTVIFGTNKGNVYISNDRGEHWVASYSGASTGGTNPGVNEIAFKDSTHGIVGHSSDTGDFDLFSTSDGGVTWTPITHTGTAYDYGLAYVPGTENMYVSTGGNQNLCGASYSLDGGISWIDYTELVSTQMFATEFVENHIGWAGAYPTDETTGGMFKHVPSENPLPAFTVGVTGGKGFIVTVTNIGEVNATDVTCDINIEGGLIVNPKAFSDSAANLGVGENFTVLCAPKGIGLGFLTPIPTIKISVNCTEGVPATKTATAKLFFSMVTLQ
jgi:photosystem II stability/assembly factor-like uncharacterized protein